MCEKQLEAINSFDRHAVVEPFAELLGFENNGTGSPVPLYLDSFCFPEPITA